MRISRTVCVRAVVSSCTCVALLMAAAGAAQQQRMAAPAAKTPTIASLFPPGGQRGSTATIEVKGKNLSAVTDLYFSRPVGKITEIKPKSADIIEATIALDPAAEPGPIEIRAVSQDGISNLRFFRVDELPEVIEAGAKNETPAQAQAVQWPAVVSGQLTAADIDCYAIHVDEKQRLVIEVEARRIGSPTEARLRLLESSGRIIADAATTRAIRPDERIDHEFAPGTYIIAVEDAQYVGGDGAVYRLRIGSWPYATSVFPLGGRRGESIELTFEGGNLDAPVTHKVDVPADPRLTVFRPQFTGERGTLVSPMLLAIGDHSETMETEPNDDPKQPQPIDVPTVVNGRIAAPGDKDRFLVKAKKGEKLTIEVWADRLGSWLDSVVTVSDKNGRQLAENDDVRAGNQQQNVQNKTGLTPISDSRLDFTMAGDGEFIVTVDDRYLSGGSAFVYRLAVTRSLPDFQLACGPAPPPRGQPQPKNQQPASPSDVVYLEPGKSAAVSVNVTRRGYDGEIELAVEGLPPGATFEPAKIPAKQAAGQVTIKAADDATTHVERIRVVGSAKINDQQVQRVVANEIVVAQFDPLHTARLEMDDFALALIRRETPLAIKVDGEAIVARGLEAELKVAVERRAGLKGPVEIRLDKLPKGVTAEKVTVADDASEAIVKLTAASSAAIAKQKIQIVSQGKVGAATVETSAEIALAVVMPFELTLDPKEKELDLIIGESCTLKVGVRRQGSFDGPIELAVSGLPGGVSVTPDTVDAEQDEVELSFVVAEDAKPVSGKKPIKIQATGEIGKQKVKFETAAIQVRVKKPD